MNINTKRKVKKYGIIATCMTMIAVIGFATNRTVYNQVNATEEIEQYTPPKQYVSFDDNSYTIQINVEELENCTFPNLFNYLDDIASYNSITIYYLDDAYHYNGELSVDGSIAYTHSDDEIEFIYENVEFNAANDRIFKNYQFAFNTSNVFTEFFILELQENDYGTYIQYKNAIALDIANYDYTHLPYAVKLQAQQLNNDKFTYLAEQLNENANTFDFDDLGNVIYLNYIFYVDDFSSDSLNYTYPINEDDYYNMSLILLDSDENYGKFDLDGYIHSEYIEIFTSYIIIYDSQFIYENIYAPLNTSDIPDAITSGLGIIGDLASEFLNGFKTLFWDADNAKLTYLAIFSLAFLGVAISIAVVKLASRMIRNNTGV